MKVLVVVALLIACVSATSIPDIPTKFIPSFATGYVIKGEDATPHAAPYIVSLSSKPFEKHAHICGGTIIAREWILTAAHCISKPVGMGAIAGLHLRSNVDEKTQSREIDFGKVHDKYTGGVGPYDIALLHVSEPFEFNEFVQPAVLPVREEIHEGETHLYGWGQKSWYGVAGASTLQTVATEIIEYNKCVEMLPENAPIDPKNICSDHHEKGISACNGDSGGPLVIEHKGDSKELVGIVSWGYIPCGSGGKPSIYTRVSAYVDWIDQVKSAYYFLF